MGVKISIDKHVSELDDILEMSPHYLSRVQFESKIEPEITQHLKVSNPSPHHHLSSLPPLPSVSIVNLQYYYMPTLIWIYFGVMNVKL